MKNGEQQNGKRCVKMAKVKEYIENRIKEINNDVAELEEEDYEMPSFSYQEVIQELQWVLEKVGD